MDRILQNAGAVLTVTFTVDGVAADPSPDEATVIVTGSDGTEIYNGAAADDGTGTFDVVLTPAMTADLDTLTATWTLTYGSEPQVLVTTAEVVGGFLFTLAEARAIDPLQNTTKYTTAQIIAARTLAEQALEDVCGVAFVPRYGTETLDGTGGCNLLLSQPKVTAIRSVTINGAAVADLTAFTARRTGFVNYTAAWPQGYGNVTVGYEHGWAVPPARVSRAALRLAKRWLVEGPVDDRATSLSSEDGTFALLTPGVSGVLFDIPEVVAVTQIYGGFNVGIA